MKNILKIISINFIIFFIGILVIELIFGKWFYKNNYGSLIIPNYSISEINQSFYDNKKTYIRSRDKNGFRANKYNLKDIDILVIGGSTTAERFIDDNHLWTKVFERKISNKTDYKVLNAGIGGQTAYGHNNMFELWFSRYKDLQPKFILIYLGVNDAIKIKENIGKNNSNFQDINYSKLKNDNLKSETNKENVYQYIKNNSAIHLLFLIIKSMYISNKYQINNPEGIKLFDYSLQEVKKNPNNISKKISNEKKIEIENFLPIYEKNIISIIQHSKNLNADPIFITNLLPTDEKSHTYSINLSMYLDIINNKTISICKKFNIECLDLRNKINLNSIEDFYDPIHTTPKGSAKIGRLISKLFLDLLEKNKK